MITSVIVQKTTFVKSILFREGCYFSGGLGTLSVFIYACGLSRREILNALLNWSDKKAKKAGKATTILVM